MRNSSIVWEEMPGWKFVGLNKNKSCASQISQFVNAYSERLLESKRGRDLMCTGGKTDAYTIKAFHSHWDVQVFDNCFNQSGPIPSQTSNNDRDNHGTYKVDGHV